MNFPELCCNINKLKSKQANLEKNEDYTVRFIDNNFDSTIKKEYDKLKYLREQCFGEVRKDLQKNMKSLEIVQSVLKEKKVENIDIFSLKLDMLSLENFTNVLKEKVSCEHDKLLNNEKSLTADVSNIEMKINDFNKTAYENGKSSKYSLLPHSSNHFLYQGVKEFLKFLNETGGHDGGWDRKDHLLFINTFNKIKNKQKLITYLQKYFPEKPVKSLSDHIDWYNTYLDLRNKQKEEIDKWKEERVQKLKETQIISGQSEEHNDKLKKKVTEHYKNVKDRIEKWKEEKQLVQKQINDIRIKEKEKIKETEKQKQLKNIKLKKEIFQRKTDVETKKQTEMIVNDIICSQEKERRINLANRLIKEFQHQDNHYITKRLAHLKSRGDVPSAKVTYRKKESKKNVRDPERIFRSTKQWIARTTAEKPEETMFNKYVPLKKIQKLATPVWKHVEV